MDNKPLKLFIRGNFIDQLNAINLIDEICRKHNLDLVVECTSRKRSELMQLEKIELIEQLMEMEHRISKLKEHMDRC